jgi:hypothetical protein
LDDSGRVEGFHPAVKQGAAFVIGSAPREREPAAESQGAASKSVDSGSRALLSACGKEGLALGAASSQLTTF